MLHQPGVGYYRRRKAFPLAYDPRRSDAARYTAGSGSGYDGRQEGYPSSVLKPGEGDADDQVLGRCLGLRARRYALRAASLSPGDCTRADGREAPQGGERSPLERG